MPPVWSSHRGLRRGLGGFGQGFEGVEGLGGLEGLGACSSDTCRDEGRLGFRVAFGENGGLPTKHPDSETQNQSCRLAFERLAPRWPLVGLWGEGFRV